jgi:PAS domain S-box-containing protein
MQTDENENPVASLGTPVKTANNEAGNFAKMEAAEAGYVFCRLVYDTDEKSFHLQYDGIHPLFAKLSGIENTLGETIRASPEKEAFWVGLIQQVIESGAGIQCEFYAQEDQNWYDIHCLQQQDGGGERVILFFKNSSKMKALQARQRLVADIRKLFSGPESSGGAMPAATGIIGEFFRVSFCGFIQLTEDAGRSELVSYNTAEAPEIIDIPHEIKDEYILLLTRGGNVVCRDLEKEPGYPAYPFTEQKINAYTLVPVSRPDKRTCFLTLADTLSRDWTGYELEVMEELSGLLARFLDRALAWDLLQRSEARTRLAIESAKLATWEWDLVTDKVYWNEQHFLIMGMKAVDKAITPDTFLDRVHEEDREGLTLQLTRAILEKVNLEAEFRIMDGQDSIRWMNSYAHITLEENGISTRMSGIMFDITERKIAELAVRESERRLQKAMQIETVGILFLDDLGTLTAANDSFIDMSGVSRITVARRKLRIQDFTPAEWTDLTLKALTDLKHSGRCSPFEKEFVRPDQMVWWGLMAGTRLGENENVAFVIDITQRKEAEKALRKSEERFRELVQNVRDYAICMLDAGGVITEWTYGAQQVFGYSGEDVIGTHFSMLFTPGDVAAGLPDTELSQAAGTGRFEAEGLRVRKGGEQFWVSEIATALYDNEGKLVGFTKISRDITRRKKVRQALQQSEERLRIVLDSIADHAIITMDTQAVISGWNPGAQNMFGFTPEEAIGQPSDIIFTPEDRAEGIPVAEVRVAREKGRAEDERYHVRKDGSILYVSGVMSLLYNDTGQQVGFVKVARDQTQRKKMEHSLQEADRRKDEFIAMLGHELRNPLAPIRNTLQILKITHGSDQTLSSSLALMSRQVDHMVRLVNDLLDMTRISTGKIILHPERLELTELVRRAVEMSSPLFQTDHRELEIVLADEPIYILGDFTRIIQVVSNLLNNGAKYTLLKGRVILTLHQEGKEAVLSVKDDGIGIAREHLNDVFETFVQIDATIDRSQGGLGLGLSMVKQLVELHGGTVQVISGGLGHGSEFLVRIPVAD